MQGRTTLKSMPARKPLRPHQARVGMSSKAESISEYARAAARLEIDFPKGSRNCTTLFVASDSNSAYGFPNRAAMMLRNKDETTAAPIRSPQLQAEHRKPCPLTSDCP